MNRVTFLAAIASCLSLAQLWAQDPVPVEQPAGPPVETKQFEQFPKEVKHEGTRLYDFTFDPPLGTTIASGDNVTVRYKYETDKPGKVFVGTMPMNAKREPIGGHQPATLSEKSGAAESRFAVFAPGPAKSVTTSEELKAAFVPVVVLEIEIYGDVKSQLNAQGPIKYSAIPGASYSLQDKFYMERLLKEVIALRKRVEELEKKVK